MLQLKRWNDRDVKKTMLACDKVDKTPLIMLKLNPDEGRANVKKPSSAKAAKSNPTMCIKTAEWLNMAAMIEPLYFARHPRRTILSLGHNHHDLLLRGNFSKTVNDSFMLLMENPADNDLQITALSNVLIAACDLLNDINNTGKSKGFLSKQLVNFLNKTLYIKIKRASPLTASNYGAQILNLKTDVFRFTGQLKKIVAPPKGHIKSAGSTTSTLISVSAPPPVLSKKVAQVSRRPKKPAIQAEKKLKFTKELHACPALIGHSLRCRINLEINSLDGLKKIGGYSSRADRIQAIATYLKAFIKLGSRLREVASSYDRFFQEDLFNGLVLPKLQLSCNDNSLYIRELEEIIQILDDLVLNEKSVSPSQESSAHDDGPLKRSAGADWILNF